MENSIENILLQQVIESFVLDMVYIKVNLCDAKI